MTRRHRWAAPSKPLTTSTTERVCTVCGLTSFKDFGRLNGSRIVTHYIRGGMAQPTVLAPPCEERR